MTRREGRAGSQGKGDVGVKNEPNLSALFQGLVERKPKKEGETPQGKYKKPEKTPNRRKARRRPKKSGDQAGLGTLSDMGGGTATNDVGTGGASKTPNQ